MSDTLVNRIANSGLITLRPEEWISTAQVAPFDLKDFLYKGLILKEQDFRDFGRGDRDTGKSEDTGNHRDNEEYGCPIQHGFSFRVVWSVHGRPSPCP